LGAIKADSLTLIAEAYRSIRRLKWTVRGGGRDSKPLTIAKLGGDEGRQTLPLKTLKSASVRRKSTLFAASYWRQAGVLTGRDTKKPLRPIQN